jgi:hypothetical protein
LGITDTSERIELLPQICQALPLRMRKERLAYRCAELDAQPWRRMRVVEIETEDKGSGQADDAHQAQRRTDTDTRDRPEIGDDFVDPALPDRPHATVTSAARLQPVQDRAQRRDEIEQRRRLVPYLVD